MSTLLPLQAVQSADPVLAQLAHVLWHIRQLDPEIEYPLPVQAVQVLFTPRYNPGSQAVQNDGVVQELQPGSHAGNVHVPDARVLPMGHDRQLLLFAPLQVAHDE